MTTLWARWMDEASFVQKLHNKLMYGRRSKLFEFAVQYAESKIHSKLSKCLFFWWHLLSNSWNMILKNHFIFITFKTFSNFLQLFQKKTLICLIVQKYGKEQINAGNQQIKLNVIFIYRCFVFFAPSWSEV